MAVGGTRECLMKKRSGLTAGVKLRELSMIDPILFPFLLETT